MTIYDNPPRDTWPQLMSRRRSDDSDIRQRVAAIVERVRKDGDKALKELSAEIDGTVLESLEVSAAEIAQAGDSLLTKDSPLAENAGGLKLGEAGGEMMGEAGGLKQAIAAAAANIEKFHLAQLPREIRAETAPGVVCIQRPVPIRRVGLYVPGGSAPLFSTVLMLAIPAKVAGCPEIVMCTPPRKDGSIDPAILYAASYCGIKKIYKVGGAQAIAAMAYGTQSIPKVDKIFGPGNRYATTAKQMLGMTEVAIDMPAGPSEVMVMADSSARPEFVASDLLSQAEHGPDSQVILLCRSHLFAQQVMDEVIRQSDLLPRKDTVMKALEQSRAIVLDSEDAMTDFANGYAAEHLIISMEDPWRIAGRISAAGSIFIGNWSPESAGDYASGTNHTLPTSAWAKSYSGVNVDSFMRKMTLQELSPEGLRNIGGTVMSMAAGEGLDAHRLAVKIRLDHLPTEEKQSPSGNGYTQAGGSPSGNAKFRSEIRPNISLLTPYSTARDEFDGMPDVCLDANENPFENGFNRYPDPHQRELKAAISRIKGIGPEQIFVGNGSDEAIDLLVRIFCRPGYDNIVAIAPTYGMYRVAADINDVEYREVPLKEDFSLDEGAMLRAADMRTKLMFVCSPNNPTGNSFPRETLLRLADSFAGYSGGTLVVDEAYIDFSSGESLLNEISSRPNIVILQTFSKAWGMAGLRVGLAFASEEIIRTMSNVKYPYNINGLTQRIVLSRIQNCLPAAEREGVGRLRPEGVGRPEGMVKSEGVRGAGMVRPAGVEAIIKERERLRAALAGMPGVVKVWPSDANFLLVRMDNARAIYDALVERGIIVRDRSRVKGCEGCLRITVGTKAENDRLLFELTRLTAPAAKDFETEGAAPVRTAAENFKTGGSTAADGRRGRREAVVMRNTSETQITVMVDLDGNGPCYISTGIGFFDHMLDQLIHHGGMSLLLEARGDLKVDSHHTVEDCGIALGQAILEALGDKAGIGRYGFVLPMDESEAKVLIDFGGRIDFKWDVDFHREKIGQMPTEMFRHFFMSFAQAARCNLHVEATGENEHHKIEAVFKAFARALKMAAAVSDRTDRLPSSKGMI